MRRSLPLFVFLVSIALLTWLPEQLVLHAQTVPEGLPPPTSAAFLPLVVRELATPVPTAILPTAVPTAIPTAVPTAQPTVSPTATPQLPNPTYNNCQADPNPGAAPNYPIRITAIDKVAETVTLQNVSASSVDLTGWHMCSITGNQQHPIGGMLAPGQSQTFPGPSGNIWNNSSRDDGALYTPDGRLASYWVDG